MPTRDPGPVLELMQQEETLRSPCVRICTLDDDDICIGCGRTLEEIKRWNSYSPLEQKLRMVNSIRRQEDRRRQR